MSLPMMQPQTQSMDYSQMGAMQSQQMNMNPMGYNVPGTYYGGDMSMQGQKPGMQMSETQFEVHPQRKGKWKTGMLIAAFVIALLAFIGLIIMAFVYGFGSQMNNKRPGWTVINVVSKNSILYAGGNDIFAMTNSAGGNVTVSPPVNAITTPYRSRMFIINNTGNSSDVNVKASSNSTMVDTTYTPGIIAKKTSAMYYWQADSDTFVRLS